MELCVLLVKFDFLSEVLLFCLDIGWSGICSWWTTSFRHSLSGKSEGQVTSGLSLRVGDLIDVCIMLETKMCLAVAWFDWVGTTLTSWPSWSIHLNFPNSSLIVRRGIPFSNSLRSVLGLRWYLDGWRSLGARPLTTIPSCMIRVVPLCQTSMSRRYPTEPRSSNDFAWALSCDFHMPTSCPNSG